MFLYMIKPLVFKVLRNVSFFFECIEIRKGELFLIVKKSVFLNLITYLKMHSFSQVKQFVDLCVVDNPSSSRRFTLVYSFLSICWNFRVNILFSVSEVELVPSVSSLYPSAIWAEREAFDLFGLFFSGHPDLRRILTDYGFKGFPMRKDFPLTGYVEVRFDDEQKRVLYEPLELAQEFRTFDFSSPWTR